MKYLLVLAQLGAAALLSCLHHQNKSGFLEGWLLSSQSEQFKKYSKISDWLEKSRPSITATFVLIIKTGYVKKYEAKCSLLIVPHFILLCTLHELQIFVLKLKI